MHDDNPFHFSILPIDPFYDTKPTPPSAETQQDALNDIQQQFVTYMSRAVAERDAFKAVRLIANCERICDAYTSEKYPLLAKFQAELQSDMYKVWRMARRQFIKRALLSPAHEFPLYLADLRDPKLHLDDADSLADFHAVERHLDARQPLFADLHKRTARN
jgi:hypothetical protein